MKETVSMATLRCMVKYGHIMLLITISRPREINKTFNKYRISSNQAPGFK